MQPSCKMAVAFCLTVLSSSLAQAAAQDQTCQQAASLRLRGSKYLSITKGKLLVACQKIVTIYDKKRTKVYYKKQSQKYKTPVF